jgi:tetratricopeptide (TPR) repeat protein
MTQLWLFRAYSLARRDTEEDLKEPNRVLIETDIPVQVAKAPGEASASPPQTEVVKDAAKVVLQQPRSDLRTAPQYASYGVALALNDKPRDAADYLQIASTQDPLNLRYVMSLGRALISAQRYKEAIGPLERALELAQREGDTTAQTSAVLDIMLAGLYATDIANIDKVIGYGEQSVSAMASADRALGYRYLACAYGQKYSYNKRTGGLASDHEEQRRLRERGLAAINADLAARGDTDRERERTYLRMLMIPPAGSKERDLRDFAEFEEFQQLLAPR